MPKCKYCETDVNKEIEEFIKHSNKYYHQKCFDILEKERQDREVLTQYIMDIYKISFPTGFMLKQIKEYRTERQYTYAGMVYTLRFMYEVEKIPVKEGTGLGLITFYYEKAREYYRKLLSNQASAKNVELQKEPEIVIVEKYTRDRKPKMIDMGEI